MQRKNNKFNKIKSLHNNKKEKKLKIMYKLTISICCEYLR